MNQKLLISFFIATLLTINCFSQGAKFSWAKKMGGPDWDHPHSIALDLNGNCFTTGLFNGTVDFDPGPGTFNLNSNGIHDIFIQKLDNDGNFLWAKQIGGIYNDQVYKIITDINGNVYFTGVCQDTVDMDPGPGVYYLAAPIFSFIEKLDSSGTFLWAKKFGGSLIRSIDIGLNGDVNASGYFHSTIDFNPDTNVIFNLTSQGPDDGFILKLNSNGDFISAMQFGGVDDEIVVDAATDGKDNHYIAGYYNSSSFSYFILKIDSSWNTLWTKHVSYKEFITDIMIDQDENVYSCGYFRDTVDFDPGPGIFNLISFNILGDAFIQKFDSSGNLIWVRQLKGMVSPGESQTIAITRDSSGNIYSTGYFRGTVDLDPSVNIQTFASIINSNDPYILKLDSNGNFVWAKQITGVFDDEANGIVTDGAGNIFTTGWFTSADFDPGPGVFNLNGNTGSEDVFIQKMEQCNITVSTLIQTHCGTDSLNGQSYNISGIYTQWLTNYLGCDSVLTLNLIIYPVPLALYTMYPDTAIPHHWFVLNQCSGTAPLSYSWNWGDGTPPSTGLFPSHTYAVPGYYNICVTVTDSAGCISTYCDSSTYLFRPDGNNSIVTINVVQQLPTNIEEQNINVPIANAFPNPFSNELTVKSISKKGVITIIDVTGRIILQQKTFEEDTKINTELISSGFYLLKYGVENKTANIKLMKLSSGR